ncbi:MAG: transcriptional repressor [Candidatus Margulisbacteria bacterium]|nr:transcriptional repressor [Candidatus Margulisiibacteriota bacterium]
MDATPYNYFKEYLKKNKLRFTKQREIVLKAFLQKGGHLGIEELYSELRKKNPGIGHTTVYRTLKLLNKAQVASEISFTGRRKRYEPQLSGTHHDHFVCRICGRVIEFYDPVLEKRQGEICKKRKFKEEGHMMQIFGVCRVCNEKKG